MKKGPLLRCNASVSDRALEAIISNNRDIMEGLHTYQLEYVQGFMAHMEEARSAVATAPEDFGRSSTQEEETVSVEDLEQLLSNGA